MEKIRLSQAVKNDPHTQLLEAYFWHFVDQGDVPQDTPLFSGVYEGDSLAWVIARDFGLQLREAESAIEIARQEVAL
jgi:hypothetical protein